MKPLIPLVFLVVLNPLFAQNRFMLSDSAQAAIDSFIHETKFIAENGDREEALKRYEEFFNFSFDQKPSAELIYKTIFLNSWGGRLALGYTPALLAFISYRDEKINEFRQGIGYDWAFNAILKMNRILEQEEQSIWLFKELAEKNRVRAVFTYQRIKPIAIRLKRYDILEEYGYDVESEYAMKAFTYNLVHIDSVGDSISEDIFDKEYFANEVLEVMQLGLYLGDTAAVLSIREKAKSVVDDSLFFVPIDSLPALELD